jgi:hypothetical protein
MYFVSLQPIQRNNKNNIFIELKKSLKMLSIVVAPVVEKNYDVINYYYLLVYKRQLVR